MDEAVARRVEEVMASARFVQWVGVRLVGFGEGWAETELEVREELTQQDGFVHAGVLATLADHTAGAAGATTMPPDRTPLSIEFKQNNLRPAVGPMLRCRAEVLRAGRTVTVVESKVRQGEDDKLVVNLVVTLAVAPRPEGGR